MLFGEAENIIANLQPVNLEEYGSEKFMQKHSILEKLNMQSLKHALEGGDDFILTLIVDNDKLKDLIEELLCSYHFRLDVYPKIKNHICEKSNIKAYVILYHEAVIVNILENFFFHATACVSAQDYLLDVIDYCYNNLRETFIKLDKQSRLKNKQLKEDDSKEARMDKMKKVMNMTSVEELDKREEEIVTQIGIACISILRYITDHLNQLIFPIRHHLMNVKDILLLIVPLLELKPWIRINEKGM